MKHRTRRGGSHETQTHVKSVRHFLNKTWKINKNGMKHELEKLQEETEDNEDVPKFMFHKTDDEDPYMVYRGLKTEVPPNTPKAARPEDTSNDPKKRGLKLQDDHITYYRGDYPLFIPFYGEEVFS